MEQKKKNNKRGIGLCACACVCGMCLVRKVRLQIVYVRKKNSTVCRSKKRPKTIMIDIKK